VREHSHFPKRPKDTNWKGEEEGEKKNRETGLACPKALAEKKKKKKRKREGRDSRPIKKRKGEKSR